MMAEWKKYIGSDEQVKEIREATPNADMICQQARTGQEVYIKIKLTKKNTIPAGIMRADDIVSILSSDYCVVKTNKPNWYLDAEYSFTEFKD